MNDELKKEVENQRRILKAQEILERETRHFSEDEMMKHTINIFGKKYRIFIGTALMICAIGGGILSLNGTKILSNIFVIVAIIIFGITYFLNKYLTHKINKKGK